MFDGTCNIFYLDSYVVRCQNFIIVRCQNFIKGGKKMKKVVSVLLAVLMLCSLTLVAFAATMRFSVIDDVSASATTTRIQGTLGTQPVSYTHLME